MYSPGLFLASLISNYESETTRWAAGDHSLFSSTAFSSSSRLSSKGSRKVVTCLDSPFFYPVPSAAPREFFASLLFYDLTYLQFAISHPNPLLFLRPLFSSSSFLREECALCIYDRYLYFIILHAPKIRKLRLRSDIRNSNRCIISTGPRRVRSIFIRCNGKAMYAAQCVAYNFSHSSIGYWTHRNRNRSRYQT